MSRRTHLFVAPQNAPFGETVLGLRIADELHARGDEIVVYAHESLGIIARGRPFRFVAVPSGVTHVDQAIASLAAEVRATSVVLLDATTVYGMLKREGTDATFLRTVNRRVIGLDVWNLRLTGLQWDLCGTTWDHSKYSLDVTRRLIPVPIARPVGSKGLYNALPRPVAVDPSEREEIRKDFGLRGEDDRLVLLTTAHWQHPETQMHETGRRIARLLPDLVGGYLARMGPHVHAVHVSPIAYPFDELLGDRYTWLPQRSPARFAKLLAACDLHLSFNFSATTTVSAIASGIPVLLAVNSFSGATSDAVADQLSEPPSSAVRAWLDEAAPIPKFRVWPLGLHRFLEPLVRENPFTTAFDTVEVLEERAFSAALERLLDPVARAEAQARQAAYRGIVGRLPSAVEVFEGYL